MTDLTHDEIDADLAAHQPIARDPDIAWLLVAAEQERVQPYLYSHSVVVSSTPSEGYGPLTLAVVCGRAGRADVDNMATYQADRLRSGWMVTKVCASYAEAWRAADRFHGGHGLV